MDYIEHFGIRWPRSGDQDHTCTASDRNIDATQPLQRKRIHIIIEDPPETDVYSLPAEKQNSK